MSVTYISSNNFSSASKQMENITEMGTEQDPQVATSSNIAKFSPNVSKVLSFVKSLCSALCNKNEKYEI